MEVPGLFNRHAHCSPFKLKHAFFGGAEQQWRVGDETQLGTAPVDTETTARLRWYALSRGGIADLQGQRVASAGTSMGDCFGVLPAHPFRLFRNTANTKQTMRLYCGSGIAWGPGRCALLKCAALPAIPLWALRRIIAGAKSPSRQQTPMRKLQPRTVKLSPGEADGTRRKRCKL